VQKPVFDQLISMVLMPFSFDWTELVSVVLSSNIWIGNFQRKYHVLWSLHGIIHTDTHSLETEYKWNQWLNDMWLNACDIFKHYWIEH